MNLTAFPWRLNAIAYTNEQGHINKVDVDLKAPLIPIQDDMYEEHNGQLRLSASGLAMATSITAELMGALFLQLTQRSDLGFSTPEQVMGEIVDLIKRAIAKQQPANAER